MASDFALPVLQQDSPGRRGLIRSFTQKQSILQAVPPVLRRKKPTNALATRRNFQESLGTLDTKRDFSPKTQTKSRKTFHEAMKRISDCGLQLNVSETSAVLSSGLSHSSSVTYGMSVVDLWGPEYTKKSLKALGLYHAFKEIENRGKRRNLAVGTSLSARYIPRLAEDLSTMRMQGIPSSKSHPAISLSPISPFKPSPQPLTGRSALRVQNLTSIIESCSQLEADNRSFQLELAKEESKRHRKRRVQL